MAWGILFPDEGIVSSECELRFHYRDKAERVLENRKKPEPYPTRVKQANKERSKVNFRENSNVKFVTELG